MQRIRHVAELDHFWHVESILSCDTHVNREQHLLSFRRVSAATQNLLLGAAGRKQVLRRCATQNDKRWDRNDKRWGKNHMRWGKTYKRSGENHKPWGENYERWTTMVDGGPGSRPFFGR